MFLRREFVDMYLEFMYTNMRAPQAAVDGELTPAGLFLSRRRQLTPTQTRLARAKFFPASPSLQIPTREP